MEAPTKIEHFNFDDKINECIARLQGYQEEIRSVHTPEELEEYEKEVGMLTKELQGMLIGKSLQESLNSVTCEAKQRELIDAYPFKMISEGFKKVKVKTIHGIIIELRVRYYSRKGGRRRGKRYPVVYAGLIVLGIHEHCTPGCSSQVSQLTAMLASLDEAQAVLQDNGFKLDKKTIRDIAYRMAQRARVAQQLKKSVFIEGLGGRRVVISIDGGRIRLREKKRGSKTSKGRNRYKGAWREPKLIIIYVMNEEGKIDRSFMPYIDALIRSPKVLFDLLYNYLNKLNVQAAEKVVFAADGATWIWNRTQELANKLGLKAGQYYEVLDFYHAVEHLGKVASLRSGWSSKKRKAWIRKHRKLLLNGEVEKVITSIQEICRGRNSKGLRTERDYFIKNKKRMAYKLLKELNLPIGSGAVESAIRRVVNLRLKGPCIFWCKESAEAILMLRSYHKAGRWNLLKSMANLPEVQVAI